MFSDCTFNIISSIGSLGTVAAFFLLFFQNRKQNKKNKVELVMKLYSDFFNNPNFQLIFEIIEQDDVRKVEQDLLSVINGKVLENGAKEVYLSNYMNYFNALGLLTKDKVIDKAKIMEMFGYQLKTTFSNICLREYMKDYGFEKIKLILPKSFFFYGTLENSIDRNKIQEIELIAQFLVDKEKCKLSGYQLVDIVDKNDDRVYKGLVPSKEKENSVEGSLVEIKESANWFNLFKVLDNYENIETLYVRKIIQVNETDNYVWTYMKKIT